MTNVNFYDGEVHTEWGGKQPVKNGTPVMGWTVGGLGQWEGKVYPAELWSWDILNVESDLKAFRVVNYD